MDMKWILLVLLPLFLLINLVQSSVSVRAYGEEPAREELKTPEEPRQGEAKKPEPLEASPKQTKSPEETATEKEGPKGAGPEVKGREIPPEVLKQFGSRQEEKSPEGARLEILKAMLTANGVMLDIRYRVVGVKRFDRKVAYILNESTGEKFALANLPKIGPLGPRRLRVSPQGITGISYFIVNHGRTIQKGQRITVAIGDLKQEHVLVED